MPGTDEDRPCSVCGDPLDVCTEQRRLTFERCCPACSTRETHAAAHDQAGQDDSPPSRAELALIRTLSDIDDGHLSLWIKGRFFDPHTGDALDPPQIEVIADRQPYRGVPDPGGAWWRALQERGWLEMPVPGTTPMRYRVSRAGCDALQVARRAGRLPGRSPGASPGDTEAPVQHPDGATSSPSAPRDRDEHAACGIAWGVCPDHGATLASSGDLTRCQECGRRWPGDQLNQPCPEPITRTEEARHLMRTGMCDGHAVALTAVYGIETEPLRPGRPAPQSGTWDQGGEAAAYVRRRYQLPTAKRHARITVDGRPGAILGFRGGYVQVRFDDDPTRRVLCHPTAGIAYPAVEQPGPALPAGRSARLQQGDPL